ncbi:hypothetical protein Ancab_000893 [Ancistrocladus abbreviatus]
MSTSEGLSYVLTETTLALLRHPDYCISAYSSAKLICQNKCAMAVTLLPNSSCIRISTLSSFSTSEMVLFILSEN